MEAIDVVVGALNKALQDLKNLKRQAEKTVADQQQLLAETEELAAHNKVRATELDAREISLDAREKVVIPVENISAEKDQLESGWAALENDRRLFLKQCSEKKAVLDQQAADVQAQQKELAGQKILLEKDRAEYKNKILEEITKGAFKK